MMVRTETAIAKAMKDQYVLIVDSVTEMMCAEVPNTIIEKKVMTDNAANRMTLTRLNAIALALCGEQETIGLGREGRMNKPDDPV